MCVRDTHSAKAPRTPIHKMDACLVWSGSTSADLQLQVKWSDVICPIEIKPEINIDCVRQLCDTASEIFVQQAPRELVFGVGMSSREVQLFQFSFSDDGEPYLSWSHPMPLFQNQNNPQMSTSGFNLLVELLAQQTGALGFLPRGVDSEFLKFLTQNAHVRNTFDVALLQPAASRILKPELMSLRIKLGASSSSSSLSSLVDSAAVHQMISDNPVELNNLVLDSVCVAANLFSISKPLAVWKLSLKSFHFADWSILTDINLLPGLRSQDFSIAC